MYHKWELPTQPTLTKNMHFSYSTLNSRNETGDFFFAKANCSKG